MGYINSELIGNDIKTWITTWSGRVSIWHVILISAIIRFFTMSFPSDGGMIFDEVHYIGATRALLQGLAANSEHPPLAKIIGMISFTIFGDHWFGWRLPSVLFALISTYLIYAIAKEFIDERLALLASSLLIFDIVFFIHGNIFMLEISAFTFALASVLYYFRGRVYVSAMFTGIAFLCNEKSLFVLLALAFYHIFTQTNAKTLGRDARRVLIFIAICSLVGGGGLAVSDAIWRPSKHSTETVTKRVIIANNETGQPVNTITDVSTATDYEYIKNPLDHVIWMVQYYSGINDNLVTPEENFRPAWGWIAPLGKNWNNPPTYLSVVVSSATEKYYPINYRSQTPIFIWFMTLPVVGLALYKVIFRKKPEGEIDVGVERSMPKFILAWFGANFMPWFLWELQKLNMPFNHYFMFTIPAVVIGIPWFWDKLGGKYKYHIMGVHLACVIVYFFVYFPIGLVRT